MSYMLAACCYALYMVVYCGMVYVIEGNSYLKTYV